MLACLKILERLKAGSLVGPLPKAVRTGTFLFVFGSHNEFVGGMDFTSPVLVLEMFDSDECSLFVRIVFV